MSLRNKLVLLMSIAGHLVLYLAVGGGIYEASSHTRHSLVVNILRPPKPDSATAQHEIGSKQVLQQKTNEERFIQPITKKSLEEQKDADVLPLIVMADAFEPYYFHAKELTKKPLILQDVASQIIVTDSGLELHTIVLRLLINEYGGIDKVHVEQPQLAKNVEEIIAAPFYKMKFQSGQINGQPVKSQIMIEVNLGEAENLLPMR